MPRLLLLVPHGQRDTYRVREIYIEDSRTDTTLYIDEDGEESEETIRMMVRVLATIAISMDNRSMREEKPPYIGIEEEIRRR